MKASPFYLHIGLRHAGNDYVETQLTPANKHCHICGAMPVLRVADRRGYCKRHTAHAWAACARRADVALQWALHTIPADRDEPDA